MLGIEGCVLASLHVNCEHQDPLLMQCIFDECFNFALLLLITGDDGSDVERELKIF